jgi:hypothetical protein
VNVDGSFTYTPAAGFVGTKTFSYTMTDGKDTSNLALVTIEVTPITIIPSNPIPHDPGTPVDIPVTDIPAADIPVDTVDSELPTLAYTGTDDVTVWLIAPAAALLALGGLGVWLARRRSVQQ